MKHFNIKNIFSPAVLLWIFPLLLIIPNIALAFTESDPLLFKITDIILPLGIYYMLTSITLNIGLSVICCLPLMILAAFQIVLLYLYGESIIAIDMFLNVATTNVGEVTELLGNLLFAITVVIVLYLPPIVWATTLMLTKSHLARRQLFKPRRLGVTATLTGLILLVCCILVYPDTAVMRHIFPVNVCSNLVTAIKRTAATTDYKNTSASFSYHPTATRESADREIYVFVIGETSRADNWQLNGYSRPTNPRLSNEKNLIFYPKALSESNTTHKSVPMLMSYLDASNFGDSIYTAKSIFALFNDMGYRTAYFSNQSPNHSFIDFFGAQADTSAFIKSQSTTKFDFDLLEPLSDFISNNPDRRLFIVLHTYGSHFNYRERYPDSNSVFKPDNATDADKNNRNELVNAYDNTIAYTDCLLDSIIQRISQEHCNAALVYTSDHGEDIFDDSRERFLHASPTPTYYQVHVPFIVWTSDEYATCYPETVSQAFANRDKNVSSSKSVFNTLIDLAGLSTSYADKHCSLVSDAYHEPRRIYLNDYNESVELVKSGFKEQDITNCKSNNISTR